MLALKWWIAIGKESNQESGVTNIVPTLMNNVWLTRKRAETVMLLVVWVKEIERLYKGEEQCEEKIE